MRARTRRRCLLGIALLRQGARLGVVAALGLAAAPGGASGLVWSRVGAGAHGEAVTALAVSPEGLAVGDARGVQLVAPGGRSERLLSRGPVWDLALLVSADGSGSGLLAATDEGLYRLERGASPRHVAPAPDVRSVRRIAAAGGWLAVASDSGVYVSRDGERWQRPALEQPSGPSQSVALRANGAAVECWSIVEGRVWRASWSAEGAVRRAERELLPLAGEEAGPVDVRLDVPGVDAVVLLAAEFAVREAPGAGFRSVRPSLPPGVRSERLVVAAGRLWLATDRGLLVADALEGPWQRAQAPAGSAHVRALVESAGALYAAADVGVLEGSVASASGSSQAAGAARPALRRRTPEFEPPIESVQRAALGYLDLRAERVAAMRSGVARRGWLPIVSVQLVQAEDRDRGTDRDEAIVSGDLRLTTDRAQGRTRDLEARMVLSWDLGDVLHHPEAVDVSREAREVIKLRDDVLDELTQLYFERRRVLAELAALQGPAEDERLRLELRASELAAGIDAWTGGWFSRARAGLVP